MRRWLFAPILVLALGAATALAQDSTIAPTDCPDDLVCVAYGQDIFELDPSCGPVIGIVTEQTTTTTRTLDDPEGETTITGRALVFTVRDDGGYEVVADVPIEDVAFDEIGCLAWGAE